MDWPHLQFEPGDCNVSLQYCSSAKTDFAMRKRGMFIYALVDPRDDLPFYIGKTYNPAQRFQGYDYLTRRPDQARGSAVAIANRFQDILAAESLPIMRLLMRTALRKSDAIEASAIKQYRAINPQLLNRRLNEQAIKSGRSTRKRNLEQKSKNLSE